MLSPPTLPAAGLGALGRGRLRARGAAVGSSGCFLVKLEVAVEPSFPQGWKSGAAGFSCTGAV